MAYRSVLSNTFFDDLLRRNKFVAGCRFLKSLSWEVLKLVNHSIFDLKRHLQI